MVVHMDVQLEKTKVHYEVYGNGHPLVLLHGLWVDHRIMLGCIEPVFENRNGWQRIYLDLPGMGKTEAQEWITNSDHMLEVVIGFIDKVIPGQHFALAGYSYGGYLARGVIYRKAALVDGLLQICPMIIANMSERTVPPREILIKAPELISRLTPEEREEFEGWVAVQSQEIWERTRKVDSGSALADKPFLSHLQAEGYAFSFDVDASLDRYRKPTLILLGRQDWIVGYRDAWKLIETYSRASFVVLDRAGHNLPIEHEDLFNVLVHEWLDRVEESLALR
jgi:pimeloyl-ACP methyl ester carboxylesterase